MKVPDELTSFKDSVGEYLGNINSTIKTLSEELIELKNYTTTAQNGFNENYKSKNKDTIISTFSSLITATDTVSNSITSDAQSIISGAENLVDKISTLEGYVSTYNTQQDIILSENRKEKPDNSVLYRASTKAREALNDYNDELPEAQKLLETLKGMDSNLISEDVTTTDPGTNFAGISLEDLKNLTPGSYTLHSYIGKNGKEVKYWLYVPENINKVDGLPVTAYMCGGCERGNNCNDNSLPLYIKEGRLKPDGIVITLVTDENYEYTDPNYLSTCKEIIDNTATTFNADTNRISISGHSNGGKGVLALAGRYPDYFSVCVPVCGFSNGIQTAVDSGNSKEILSNLERTHIVGVTGTGDERSRSSINNLFQLVKGNNNMSIEMISGYDHTTTFHKYYEPVTIEGKQYNKLLEFLFTSTKV